jgi:hypothetical protein
LRASTSHGDNFKPAVDRDSGFNLDDFIAILIAAVQTFTNAIFTRLTRHGARCWRSLSLALIHIGIRHTITHQIG